MMSISKIFVTIISVVSLTLVNVNSTDRGGSSSSRRFYNVPFKIYATEYRCYKEISQFCQAQFSPDDEVTSLECAKQGMLKYHKDAPNLLDSVHYYFKRFPLDSEAIDLPKAFCENKAKTCMTDLREYNAIVIANPPKDDSQRAVESAERKSRREIAMFAFLNKALAKMDRKRGPIVLSLVSRPAKDYGLEKDYLHHLSEKIGTENPTFTPLHFCARPEMRRSLLPPRPFH